MNIFKFVFGRHETQIPKVENTEPEIDFETKLYKIIDTFGKDVCVKYDGNVYKYKSIEFVRSSYFYSIYINDVTVYSSSGNHDDDNKYWNNDIITPKCKSRIMDLVNELYIKALAKIIADRVIALERDQLKVKQGCMELYDD
jgi:hypothetical protein